MQALVYTRRYHCLPVSGNPINPIIAAGTRFQRVGGLAEDLFSNYAVDRAASITVTSPVPNGLAEP